MGSQDSSDTATFLSALSGRWGLLYVVFVTVIVGTLMLSIVRPYITFDGANYLTTAWSVFKGPYTGLPLRRPYLIAFILGPLAKIFDPEFANRLLAVGSALGFSIPLYLLYVRVSREWFAGAAAVLTVLLPAYAGMLNWGYITFIGLIFYYLSLVQLLRTVEAPTHRNTLLLAVCFSLVFLSHQVTAIYLVTTAATYFVLRVLRDRQAVAVYTRIPAAGLLSLVFAAPVLFVYVTLVTATISKPAAAGSTTAVLLRIVNQAVGFAGDFPAYPFILLPIMAIIGHGFLNADGKHQDLVVAIGSISIPSLTVLLHSVGARMLYFWPPVVTYLVLISINRCLDNSEYLAAGLDWLVGRTFSTARVRKVLYSIVVIALLIGTLPIAVSYVQTAELAHDKYQSLSTEQIRSLDWVETHTEPDATFAVSHKAFGWAIEGYTIRNAFEPDGQKNYMKQFLFAGQRRQAAIQDRIFSRNIGLVNGNVRASLPAPYNGTGNPTLGVNTGNYRTFAYFDDAHTQVTVVSDGTTATHSLATARKQVFTPTTPTGETITVQYRWEDYSINKTVTVPNGNARIHVRFSGVNQTRIKRLRAPIHFSQALEVTGYDLTDEGIRVRQHNGFGMHTESTFLGSDNTIIEPRRSSSGLSSVLFRMPGEPFSITISYDLNRALFKRNTTFYSVPHTLQASDIGYVAALKYTPSREEQQYDRMTVEWFRESPYYESVYDRNGVVIFKVIPNGWSS